MTRLTPGRTRETSGWVLLAVLFPTTSYAYLDPDTGTYGFQMVLAAGVVLVFSARAYWRKREAKTPERPVEEDDGKSGGVAKPADGSFRP